MDNSYNEITRQSCSNQGNLDFSGFNRLMYDECNSKERYNSNNYQSDYNLGITCKDDRSEICNEEMCSQAENYTHPNDINDFLVKNTNNDQEQVNYFRNTRGYGTYGKSNEFFNAPILTNTDNALKRSGLTNLNYINQQKSTAILVDTDINDSDWNNAKSIAKDENSNTAFVAPVQNKSHYIPDKNYLIDNSIEGLEKWNQRAREVPELYVRSKGSQYYNRLGLINIEAIRDDYNNPCSFNLTESQPPRYDPDYVEPLRNEYSNQGSENNSLCAFGVYEPKEINGRFYNDEVCHRPVDSNSIFYDMSYLNSTCDRVNDISRVKIEEKLDNKLAPYDEKFLSEFFRKTCITDKCS